MTRIIQEVLYKIRDYRCCNGNWLGSYCGQPTVTICILWHKTGDSYVLGFCPDHPRDTVPAQWPVKVGDDAANPQFFLIENLTKPMQLWSLYAT